MAIQRYNHTLKKILDGDVDLSLLKIMLLDSNAAFNAAHTTLNQVSNTGAWEVDGFGWTTGGESIVSSVDIVNVDGAELACTDISVEAAGGDIGPVHHAVIYQGTTPLWFETPTSPQTASDGTPLLIPFSNGKLFEWNDPA